MVGFPFADRELSESESEALKGLGVIAAGLLALSDMAEEQRLLAEERAIQAMAQGIPLSQISDDQVYAARKSALAGACKNHDWTSTRCRHRSSGWRNGWRSSATDSPCR
ncbi:MAG: hypothetical protein HND48_10765 [Chloroflexi bacterium]|nr:hypothetical protein [Chloroflexota bacterium]